MENKLRVPTLRFPEFASSGSSEGAGDWVEKRLGDIANKIGSGSTPRGGEKVYQSSGIPFIRSQNVNRNILILDDMTYISEEINVSMKNSIVRANDILLNITGASIGRSCVVPDSFNIGNVNQHVCIIRLNEDNSSNFIQPLIASHTGQKLISQGQTGSGREGLNFQSIRAFKLTLPPLPEQQKIASFLSAVDAKISQLTQKGALLGEYKRGVMQGIFSQEIRFRSDDGSEFEGWVERTLGDLCKLQGGYAFKSFEFLKYGIPVIRISNISNNNNYIDESNIVYYDNIPNDDNFTIKKGDLLVAMSGATTGKSSIYNLDEKAYLNQRVGLFRAKKLKINYGFLIQFVFSNLFIKQLDAVLVAGAQPNISSKDIENFKLNLPSLPEQTKIANFLSSIDKKIEQNTQSLEKMKTFKRGLLQGMFV